MIKWYKEIMETNLNNYQVALDNDDQAQADKHMANYLAYEELLNIRLKTK